MPTIFFHGPEIKDDDKRKLIKSFTETASEVTGINESAFVVYLNSTNPDEVGVGGKLLADRQQS